MGTSSQRRVVVRDVADVLCDDSGRLGPLSYLIPSDLEVHVGDAVEVPFGKRTTRGMVLGVGNPAKATRAIAKVYGPRAFASEIELARRVAAQNFSTFATIAPRLAPRTKRGNPPLRAGRVSLVKGETFDDFCRPLELSDVPRRLLAVAPLVDQSRLAALEAAAMSAKGQVLVLCPTKKVVEEVLAQFASGAGRMDTSPKEGEDSAWRAFLDGTLKVAVATRSAALWAAPNLVGIIVVDEDHPGHVEAASPHTNARDIATARTLASGAELVLLSPNPSPLALGAKVKIFAVGADRHWPTTELVFRDIRNKNSVELPSVVRSAMVDARGRGEVPVIVAPAASAVRKCRGCRQTLSCEQCGGHSCAHLRQVVCPRCGSDESRVVGWDVERVSRVVGRPTKVILATELHEVTGAGLVVLFDADGLLGAPGLIPDRWATTVLLNAARAAGAGGRVVIVTSEIHAAPFDDLVVKHDIVRSAKRTWAAAKEAGLPPFGRLVTLQVASAGAPRVSGWPGTVYGPRPVGKEFEILVRCSNDDLAELGRCIDRLRKRAKLRVSVS